jgi:hypothetical protein
MRASLVVSVDLVDVLEVVRLTLFAGLQLDGPG